MNVNVIGHALVTKQFMNYTKKIVVIASIMSKVPAEKATDYAASKHALDGMFSSLRLELKRQKKNVKISIVYPWHIKTSLFEGFCIKNINLVKSLEVNEAAAAIYKGVCLNAEEIYIPSYIWYTSFLTSMLPSTLRDYFLLYSGEGALDKVKQN